jgi:hypothetical protein
MKKSQKNQKGCGILEDMAYNKAKKRCEQTYTCLNAKKNFGADAYFGCVTHCVDRQRGEMPLFTKPTECPNVCKKYLSSCEYDCSMASLVHQKPENSEKCKKS